MRIKSEVNEFLQESGEYDKEYLTKEEAREFHEKIYGLTPFLEDRIMAEAGIGRDKKGYYRIANNLTDHELDILLGIRTYQRLGKIKNLLYVVIGILVVALLLF